MLLDYLGNPVAAARIERAVAIDLAARGDSKRTTAEIAQSIFAQL
jgi:3-isopropylmalate dehydrogenase